MNSPFSAKNPGKPRPNGGQARILVAPLDWGLGHATRCIPVIRALLAEGTDVWLAGEGAQELLLKEEFPGLPFLNLPGYRIQYARTSKALVWKMIQQAPKMKQAIKAEHRWLEKAVAEYGFDAVISDNRYGLYHPAIITVFITHQLLIKTNLGKWSEKILQHRNYRYINRFSGCWVPDFEGAENLAGELSHPGSMPAVPVKYTGPISRFSITANEKAIPVSAGKLLILLSGPEPQRSLLEEKLLGDIRHYHSPITFIRGLPGNSSGIPDTGQVRFYNHLPAEALQKEIAEAEFIISRSGYSTVMDCFALSKKCIYIPTPGQTEQEYLGTSLMKKGIAVFFEQDEFSLPAAIEKATAFNYKETNAGSNNGLAGAVKDLLSRLNHPPALG